ncbi:MAG: hydroxymethylglutaryl-CoA lyase, partial [Candidatus Eremiobacteraeota bacterium]|nr:hydroxymethylglutaryl-CoA lyase [Candidatus Eremiobacteraeota bacterium]
IKTKAVGNIPTEDLVHMLSALGIETGIELPEIVAAAREISEMLEITPESYVTRNGTRAEILMPVAV